MKKLISILLMCWLPLFMSSAWAMDLQMNSGMQMQQENSASMADMPCHDMQASHDLQTSAEPAKTACTDCVDNTSDIHNCASCGLCMISLSATQIELFAAAPIATPSDAIRLPDSAFFSQDYRPAIKPPIHT
jgi:hypothetical protein